MATAGEVNYGGNIGQGEAQVFQERLHPLLQFAAQNEARKARTEADQEKLRQQQQQKRNADIQKYIDDNMGTPGWFQQENTVNELNNVRSGAQKFAMENPHADVNMVAAQFGEEKRDALRRLAKRNEVQKEIEQIRQDNNPKSTLDNNWVNVQANKVYDRDIDEVNRGEVVGLKNHPRAYDADKGIIKSVEDLKNQYNYTGVGEPQDIGFGMMIDGWSKKVRFKTDAKGRIVDETVDFVLDNNPEISQRIRWDVARKRARVQDDNYASPDEMAKITNEYNKIKFSDDPLVVAQVRGQVRNTLNQLQQVQYIDRKKIQNKPGAAGQVTQDDINDRLAKIETVTGAFGPDNSRQVPSTAAKTYLSELQGVGRFNGLPLTKIELKEAPIRTGGVGGAIAGPPKLIIYVKTGVNEDLFNSTVDEFGVKKIGNDRIEVDLNSPEAKRVLNNIWNSTNPTTKEKEIPASNLFGKAKVNIFGLPEEETVMDENDDEKF